MSLTNSLKVKSSVLEMNNKSKYSLSSKGISNYMKLDKQFASSKSDSKPNTCFFYMQHLAEIGKKNQANAKEHPKAELFLFENYSHPHYHAKIVGHILKNNQKNKYSFSVCIHETVRLIIIKMKMKMKNRSHRYNINIT